MLWPPGALPSNAPRPGSRSVPPISPSYPGRRDCILVQWYKEFLPSGWPGGLPHALLVHPKVLLGPVNEDVAAGVRHQRLHSHRPEQGPPLTAVTSPNPRAPQHQVANTQRPGVQRAPPAWGPHLRQGSRGPLRGARIPSPRPSRPQVRFVPPSPFPAFPAPGSAPARPSVRPAPGLAPRCPPLAPSCPPDSPSPAVSAPGGLTSTARGRVEGAEGGRGAPPRAQLAHPESPRPSGFSSPRARPHRAPERRPCSALYGLGGLQTFGLQRAVGLRA